MTLQELFKQPISLVIENHAENYVVLESAKISDLIDKVTPQLASGRDLNEFLIVVCGDADSKIKAVVTNQEVSRLLEIIRTSGNLNQLVSSLNMNTLFSPRYVLKESEKMESVLQLMKSNLTDMIVVSNDAGVYIGKIGRSALARKLSALLN